MARKITADAVNAFMDGENFHRDNTRVYKDDHDRMVMELHGNRIAMTIEGDDDTMAVSDAGWVTRTTYERLGELIYRWTEGKFHASMRNGGVLINRKTGEESTLYGGTLLRRA